MDLFPFQVQASTQIADRYQNYMRDPIPTRGKRIIPFYQNLSSITGSGKTLILADAIEQIRSRLPVEPIVLWLSKGKVVVWQTYTNLSTGKYAELLGGFDVKPLLDCKQVDVENSDRGLVLVTTVAKFNQKEKDPGNRKIFRLDRDAADQSLWEMLKSRKNSKGIRRPLIVVYDEGHNLTSQQTELLFELHPEGLIAASATMKVPEALSKIITRLKEDAEWTDADMVTSVQSTKVVESGLVKKQIMLGGYVTPMEIAINDMIEDMRGAEKAALTLGGSFAPKAIYVSTTNAVDGATITEESTRPFKERMARPILIWRHLVESCGVDPKTIAVYCDLKFDTKAGPPVNFNLFSGGDSDYDRFIAGDFRHIIFNLSLQEGWDDPECCFAYIDKDMGSPDQVTQVIGRVLRQPGAQHYSASVLNTAHFYIRTDEKRVFESIIDDVRKKLVSDSPDTTLSIRRVSKAGDRPINKVLKQREVPTVSIYSGAAVEPIREIVRKIINFSGNTEDTVGKGSRIQVLQTIGTGEDVQEEWVDVEHSNTVNARWVFLRELQKLHPKAARLCDIEHPKFDALIEYNSAAADHIREQALKVVEAYIEHSVIVQNSLDHPYIVDDMPYDDSKLVKFSHALHEGYSGLNGLEKEIADAIDKTKRVWCRNPSTGGFGIPLLDRGSTKTFHPDFLVWTDKHIVAIETKGDHLIVEDATRKLFHIEQIENGPELVIRFITEGKWDVGRGTQFIKESPDGFTVWTIKHGKFHPTHLKDASAAVQACLNVELAGKSS
jgi:type III restriction enzyme